jgi:hypothetical protein
VGLVEDDDDVVRAIFVVEEGQDGVRRVDREALDAGVP